MAGIGAAVALRAVRRLGDADLAFRATLAALAADIEVFRAGWQPRKDGTSGDRQ